MRILVADNTGLVKDIQVEDQKIAGSFGKQEKGMPIKNLVRIGEVNCFINAKIYSLELLCFFS